MVEYGFTSAQINQLLAPINPDRIVTSQGRKHLAQQDVRAHLIRVFGFGNFDVKIKTLELLFEEPYVGVDKNGKEILNRFNVCYKAEVRLLIRDPKGMIVCSYEEVASATAQNQTRGEAHDLAMKSAVSYAIKRCATNLGDQFGLSLYNNGQVTALVKGTLVRPDGTDAETQDIQHDLEKQTSLGDVEGNQAEPETVVGKVDLTPSIEPEYSEKTIANAQAAIEMLPGFTTIDEVQKFYNENPALFHVPVPRLKTTLARATAKRVKEIAAGLKK